MAWVSPNAFYYAVYRGWRKRLPLSSPLVATVHRLKAHFKAREMKFQASSFPLSWTRQKEPFRMKMDVRNWYKRFPFYSGGYAWSTMGILALTFTWVRTSSHPSMKPSLKCHTQAINNAVLVLQSDIRHSYQVQLTGVKIGHLLTFVTRPYRGLRFATPQGFGKLFAD